jgi:DNA recombination protein RmuC
MILLLTALVVLLLALLAVALVRQVRHANAPARASLDDGETARIVAAFHEDLTRVQGAIHKTGVDQLVEQNRALVRAETARGEEQLKARHAEIDKELVEVRREIGKLGELVRDVDARRGESILRLESVAREGRRQTELLRSETARLNEVLSGSQTRGQWGERMAEDVLRVAGFIEGVQYSKQKQIEGGLTRPDFTFFVHGQRLHMDVKTPLAGYQRYLRACSDDERAAAARDFKRDLRGRINEVTTRDYIDPAGGTLDYMLVFIPNEQVYGFIHENDPELLELALRSKVVLCSPLTLFAILAVIRQASDNFKLTQQTNTILQALGTFNDEWSKFKDQMDKLGRAIESSRRAYEELSGTRSRQLDRRLDRIEQLRSEAQLEPGAAGPIEVGDALAQTRLDAPELDAPELDAPELDAAGSELDAPALRISARRG